MQLHHRGVCTSVSSCIKEKLYYREVQRDLSEVFDCLMGLFELSRRPVTTDNRSNMMVMGIRGGATRFEFQQYSYLDARAEEIVNFAKKVDLQY